ncbi:MAG: MBOAT family O-acyltransferase [Verrucomicrobiota bacterium]
MSFLAWQYPFFLGVAVLMYWLLTQRGRILWLLWASYAFYAFWDARFLLLLLTTTTVDFFVARAIETKSSKKLLVALSCVVNLTILGFFKYFNFFADSAERLLSTIGLQAHWTLPHIILPIGISFYTFQSLACVIDVYRGKQRACRDFFTYAVYLSFFPQLLAGPIGRAPQLMPQWEEKRSFQPLYLHEGLRWMLVGLFKKVFVADNCALLANFCFDSEKNLGAGWAVLGALAFTFQIYGDFSGYTDLARGSARLFGFELMQNFRFPYFSITPSDFWQRWHISLSSWFRDCLYISLGGNRQGKARTLLNLMVTMALAGLWHGAGGMFIFWGIYYGVLLVIYRITPSLAALEKETLSRKKQFFASSAMFALIVFGWVIFRCSSIHDFIHWMRAFGSVTSDAPLCGPAIWLAIHIVPLLLLQALTWKEREETSLEKIPWVARGILYLALVLLIVSSITQDQEFIYFQF